MPFPWSGLLALVLVAVAGSGLILSESRRLGARVAECVLLGPLAVFAIEGLSVLVRVPLSRFGLASSALVAAALGVVVRRKWRLRETDMPLRGERLDVGLSLALGGLAMWLALDAPILLSDPAMIYAPPAVLYAQQGRLDPQLLLEVEDPNHLDYPPLFTANLAALFVASGGYDGWAAKLLGPLFFVGLLLELVGIAKASSVPMRWSWVLVFGLAPVVIKEATSGFADIAVTAYLAGGIASMLRWQQSARRSDALRAALMLAGAALTKNEGAVAAVMFLAVATVALVRGRRGEEQAAFHPGGSSDSKARAGLLRSSLLAWMTFLLLVVPWYVWVRTVGIENDLVEGVRKVSLVDALHRAPIVARSFFVQCFTWRADLVPRFPRNGLVFYVSAAAVLVTVATRPRWLLSWRFLLAPLQLGLFFVVFLFTYQDVRWHLDTALPRLLLQCFPALALMAIDASGWKATRGTAFDPTLHQKPL